MATSLTAAVRSRLSVTTAGDHHAYGPYQDHEVEKRRPVLDVVKIAPHGVFPWHVRASAYLPETGHAGMGQKAATFRRPEPLDLLRAARTGTDEDHVALEHVEELRQFIERVPPEPPAEPGDPGV